MGDFAEYQILVDLQKRVSSLQTTVYKIWGAVQSLQQQETKLMATAQQVLASVSEETTLDQSIITLLDGIHQQLIDAQAQIAAGQADASVLDQVMSTVAGNKQAVVDAITRNTQAG